MLSNGRRQTLTGQSMWEALIDTNCVDGTTVDTLSCPECPPQRSCPQPRVCPECPPQRPETICAPPTTCPTCDVCPPQSTCPTCDVCDPPTTCPMCAPASTCPVCEVCAPPQSLPLCPPSQCTDVNVLPHNLSALAETWAAQVRFLPKKAALMWLAHGAVSPGMT